MKLAKKLVKDMAKLREVIVLPIDGKWTVRIRTSRVPATARTYSKGTLPPPLALFPFIPPHFVIAFGHKESFMLRSLPSLWRAFVAWLTQSPEKSTSLPPVKPYYPSNLHARHR